MPRAAPKTSKDNPSTAGNYAIPQKIWILIHPSVRMVYNPVEASTKAPSLRLVCLHICAQNRIHAGLIPCPSVFEKRQHFGINAQRDLLLGMG